jgi:hypothetical protein
MNVRRLLKEEHMYSDSLRHCAAWMDVLKPEVNKLDLTLIVFTSLCNFHPDCHIYIAVFPNSIKIRVCASLSIVFALYELRLLTYGI